MKNRAWAFLSLMATVTGSVTLAATLNVPADHASIQAAINAANNGDEIVVAPGTYHERIQFHGKAVILRSTDPTSPTVVARTRINGGGQGIVVKIVNGEGPGTVLLGLTITGGNGGEEPDVDLRGYGGGICCSSSSPTIRFCHIAHNTAGPYGAGGGLWISYGSPVVDANTIRNNSAYDGGGIAASTASPQIGGNTLFNNSALNHGGGLTVRGGLVAANVVHSNSAFAGGGIEVMGELGSPGVTVTTNTVVHNTGHAAGGGMLIGGDPIAKVITGNVIRDNVLAGDQVGLPDGLMGAGVCVYGTALVANNLIARNWFSPSVGHPVLVRGGGVAVQNDASLGQTVALSNNTIASNQTAGVFVMRNSCATLTNCIIAFNDAGLDLASGIPAPGVASVSYCDLYNPLVTGASPGARQTAPSGPGNLAVDPRFVSAAADDYRLRSAAGHWNGEAWITDRVTSPCLDAGDPTAPYALEPAPNGGRVNMGYDGNTAFASKSGPKVLSWSPRGSAAGATVEVSAFFNMAMHRASVESNFLLAPEVVGAVNPVAGAFSWLGKKMTFTPTTALLSDTVYRATIKRPARSTTGQRMAEDFTWTFRTAPTATLVLLSASAAGTTQGAQVTVNLTSAANVQTTILNLAGRTVATLPEQSCDAGTTTLLWNGRAAQGTAVPSGTYLLRITARTADGAQASALASCSLRR